ncbi:hypothetical protein D9M72_589330 [compost metagenome]
MICFASIAFGTMPKETPASVILASLTASLRAAVRCLSSAAWDFTPAATTSSMVCMCGSLAVDGEEDEPDQADNECADKNG